MPPATGVRGSIKALSNRPFFHLPEWARAIPVEHVGLREPLSQPLGRTSDGDCGASIQSRPPFRCQALMKESKSALIVAASVVGMPCGKPL
jgi:hypothetical protein